MVIPYQMGIVASRRLQEERNEAKKQMQVLTAKARDILDQAVRANTKDALKQGCLKVLALVDSVGPTNDGVAGRSRRMQRAYLEALRMESEWSGR